MSVALFWYARLMHPAAPSGCSCCRARCWASPTQASGRRCDQRHATCRRGRPEPARASTTRPARSAPCSAAPIAVLIQSRLAAELPAVPGGAGAGAAQFTGQSLPEFLHAGFSTAMGQSILLPAVVVLIGAVAAAFFARPRAQHGWNAPVGSERPEPEPDRRPERPHPAPAGDATDGATAGSEHRADTVTETAH